MMITVLLIGNVIFTLLCPGNLARDLIETAARFPEYASLGLFQKLTLSAVSYIISIDQNFIMLIIMGLAWIFSWQKYKTWGPRLIGVIPFIFCVLIEMARIFVMNPKFACLVNMINGIKIADWISVKSITTGVPGSYHYLTFMAMMLFVFSLLAMTVILFKDSKKIWIAVLVMGAGIMSRVVMGFSPTVYASGSRTFLFQYIAMTIFGLLMYQEFNQNLTAKNQKRVLMVIAFMAICGYMESFLKLILNM